MHRIFFFVVLLVFPLSVFAEDDLVISSGSKDVKDFVFIGLPGSTQQGTIILENTTTESQDVTLYVTPEQGLTKEQAEARDESFLFGKMRFYPENPPEDYLKTYEENNRDIEGLCTKRDESEELDLWCDGQKFGAITIEGEEAARVAYSVRFDESSQKGDAYLAVKVATEKRAFAHTQTLVYDPPIKKIRRLIIKKLTMKRAFDATNVIAWAKNGFREAYNVEAVVESQSNENVDYNMRLVVEPVRFGEKELFDQERTLSEEHAEEHFYDMVSMPRFGSVVINGQLTYTGSNEEEVLFETEDARIFLMPMKELIILSALLGLIFVGRGFLRWRKQNVQLSEKIEEQEENYHENFIEEKKDSHKNGSIEKVKPLDDHREVSKSTFGVAEEMAQEKRTENVPTSQDNPNVDVEEDHNDVVDKEDDVVEPRPKPTQRNSLKSLDIEWIREDSTDYEGAMQVQEKKMHMKVAAFAMLFFGIFGIIIFLIISRDVILMAPKTTITLDDVATPADDVKDEEGEQEEGEEENGKEDEGEASGGEDGEESEEENSEASVESKDVTVQVLNGGGAPGAAGALTQKFEGGEYKTNNASNAKNDHTGVHIYHKKEQLNVAESIATFIKESYPDVKFQESDAVTQASSADIVVVIGA